MVAIRSLAGEPMRHCYHSENLSARWMSRSRFLRRHATLQGDTDSGATSQCRGLRSLCLYGRYSTKLELIAAHRRHPRAMRRVSAILYYRRSSCSQLAHLISRSEAYTARTLHIVPGRQTHTRTHTHPRLRAPAVHTAIGHVGAAHHYLELIVALCHTHWLASRLKADMVRC